MTKLTGDETVLLIRRVVMSANEHGHGGRSPRRSRAGIAFGREVDDGEVRR